MTFLHRDDLVEPPKLASLKVGARGSIEGPGKMIAVPLVDVGPSWKCALIPRRLK